MGRKGNEFVKYLEGCRQRRKSHLSGAQTVGLLNLHKAEVVRKHSREMSVTFSICVQEPPVLKIKSIIILKVWEPGSRDGRMITGLLV